MSKKIGQARIDEFAFVLLAGILLIVIFMVAWGTPREAPPIVEPAEVTITVQKGFSFTFDLTIKGKLTNVSLEAKGEIRPWVFFDKNMFDVIEQTKVRVTVRVPHVMSRIYTGNIIVKSLGGEVNVPLSINVVEHVTREFSRPMPLGDFSVSYTSKQETLDSKENFEVSSGYFTNYQKNLVGVIQEEKINIVSDGYIQLIVDDTNRAGNLIVLFNDKEVFNGNVGPGEIFIPIKKEEIKTSNSVNIRTTNPGWKFWMNTVYRFKTAKFVVNYKGSLSKEIVFSLTEKEAMNFDRLHLFYRVKNYSIPLPEMLIEINDQIIFYKRPPLAFFNDTFKKDIFGREIFLNVGNNTISFSFEKEAYYEIANAMLTVYYLESA